jgi:hypothetical protein
LYFGKNWKAIKKEELITKENFFRLSLVTQRMIKLRAIWLFDVENFSGATTLRKMTLGRRTPIIGLLGTLSRTFYCCAETAKV